MSIQDEEAGQQQYQALMDAMRNATDPAERDRLDKEIQAGRASGRFGQNVKADWDQQVAGQEQTHGSNDPAGSTFKNPGSVIFDPDGTYKNQPLQDSHNNDALQASAAGSMAYGLSQMQGDRGPQAVENATLVGRENASRASQQDALGLSMQAAMGNAPSEAAFQTTQGMNGLMGADASAKGSARGLSALNGAGLGGSSLGASASAIAGQGGLGRSKEITDAMGQYGALAGAARGSDLGRLAQNSQNSNFNADLNDQWKLGWGQNAVNSGKLGNALDLTDQQRYGASMQPAETQLQSDQAMQGIQQGAEVDKSAIGFAKNVDKRKSDHDLYMGIGGSVVGAAGTAAGGPLGGVAAGAAWKGANS